VETDSKSTVTEGLRRATIAETINDSTCIDGEGQRSEPKCRVSKPGNAAVWYKPQIHLRPTTRPPPSVPSTTSTLSHLSSSLLPPITTLGCFPPHRTMEGRLDDAAFDRSMLKKKIRMQTVGIGIS